MSEHPLETVYWLSQIALLLIAIAGGVIALQQLRAFKLFEIVRYIDDPDFQAARGVVLREIAPRKADAWWEGGSEQSLPLLTAAYLVCGRYHLLQVMLENDALDKIYGRFGYGRLILHNWSPSILRTHEALSGFITWHRRSWPGYYRGFDRLQRAAARQRL